MPANIKDYLVPVEVGTGTPQSRQSEWREYFKSPDNDTEWLGDPALLEGAVAPDVEGTNPGGAPSVSTRQVIPEDEGDDDTLPWNDRTWDVFADTLGGLESSHRYHISGGYNDAYDGKYQVGRLAKLDAGARLGIELGHDPASREAFRNDPDLQERVFEAFTQSNHDTLMRISSRYRGMSRSEKLATLGVAHILGSGGAKQYLNGVDGADGFGTKGSKYYEAVLAALNG